MTTEAEASIAVTELSRVGFSASSAKSGRKFWVMVRKAEYSAAVESWSKIWNERFAR